MKLAGRLLLVQKTCRELLASHRFLPLTKCLHSSVGHDQVDVPENIEQDDPDVRRSCLHRPVMVEQVLELLKPRSKQRILDMTFGAGGHTRAILDAAPDAQIFALDRDPSAHEAAKELAEKTSGQVTPLLGRFSEVHRLLADQGIEADSLDAVLIDAGVSSMQFDEEQRGFALSRDGPLDMRMDRERSQMTAADVVNKLDEEDLYQIIKRYGEEKQARSIARNIVDCRYSFGKITRTRQLANIVAMAVNAKYKTDKLQRRSHVATKTFQALRIFVNNELNELHNGLNIVHELLRVGGVCVAVTFHSLEDRIVKRLFHGIDMDEKFNLGAVGKFRRSVHGRDVMEAVLSKQWSVVSRRPVTPTEEEVAANPRARSAKLRAATKL